MKLRIKLLIVVVSFFIFTLPAHASELSDLIKKADAAFHADDYETAAELYTKALEIEPTDYMAWLNLGFSLAELERYDESLKCYDKAKKLGAPFTKITHCNDKAVELNGIANIYKLNYKNPEKAIEYFLMSLEADPSDAGISNSIAWTYRDIGQYEKSEEYFKLSLKTNSLFENPYGALGTLYYENIDSFGSPDKVILCLSIASKVIDPNSKYVADDLKKIRECQELLKNQQ